MRNVLESLRILVATVVMITSCNTAKLYNTNGKDTIYSGQLKQATYDVVRKILSTNSTRDLGDTIVIRYDYNNETCWNVLDQRDDNNIQRFITRHNERIKALVTSRPNLSVFEFKEPGKNLNKIKNWNNSIIVDTPKQLYNLLFKARSICGNSMILLPDRRFVFIRSDSHAEALDVTSEKIKQWLSS